MPLKSEGIATFIEKQPLWKVTLEMPWKSEGIATNICVSLSLLFDSLKCP